MTSASLDHSRGEAGSGQTTSGSRAVEVLQVAGLVARIGSLLANAAVLGMEKVPVMGPAPP